MSITPSTHVRPCSVLLALAFLGLASAASAQGNCEKREAPELFPVGGGGSRCFLSE